MAWNWVDDLLGILAWSLLMFSLCWEIADYLSLI